MKKKQLISGLLALVMVLMVMPFYSTQTEAATDGKYTWPMNTSFSITSGFYAYDNHNGVDLSAAIGNDVYAVADGTVIRASDYKCQGSHRSVKYGYCSLGSSCAALALSWHGSFANHIIIDHGNNVYSVYAHLKADSFTVTAGQTVKQGQKIACSGNTGNTMSSQSNGAHLHFELRISGNSQKYSVNPANYLTKTNVTPSQPTPPSATLSINRTQISPNETIIFTFGGNNNATYDDGVVDMAIFRNDTLVESISGISDSNMAKMFAETGSYKAFITAYTNTGSYVDSNWVYWEVNPLSATLAINRTKISPNESITFSFGGYNNSTYDDGVIDMAIYKNDVFVESISGIGEPTYTKQFAETGSYKAFITAYSNATSYVDSNWVYWEVNPLSATLAINKTKISQNESITFSFGGYNNSTYDDGVIDMAIYKNDVLVESISGIGEPTYTKQFAETGSYKAFITAYSNATSYVDSNWVYWEVVPTLTSIYVSTFPTKTAYNIGDLLDTTGLELTLFYSDGTTEVMTEGFEITGFDSTVDGEKTVTVSYGGYGASFSVTVIAPTPIPGDLNNDGTITMNDVNLFSRVLAGADIDFDGNADVDGDGKVTMIDFNILSRKLSGAEM